MKICIDPGHTKGYNAGVNANYREGTAMYTLAVKLKAALEQYDGVSVVITRTLDENPSVEQRAKIARQNGCELLVSLHSDAAANPQACGVSVFYSVKRESQHLAEDFAKAVADVMKVDTGVTYPRGAKTRTYVGKNDGKTYDYYGVIRNAVIGDTVAHAVIVEHGFHTHPAECQWLLQDGNLDKLATCDAMVIAEYFGLERVADQGAAPDADTMATPGDDVQKGDIVSIRSTATTYGGDSTVNIPAWVKQETHTVASIGTVGNRREGQARLLEINSWVNLDDLVTVKRGGGTDLEEGDAVQVVGTDVWTSGVKMAAWVTKGTVFYVHSTRENGAVAVIGKKVAGEIAVTGAVYSKYLKKV